MKLILAILPALLAFHAAAAGLPLHPDDLTVVRMIAEREKLDATPVAEPPGQNAPRASTGRVKFSVKADGVASRHVLYAHHDENGRVLGLVGNGPILGNEAFGWISALRELRVIRIDHNIPAPKSPVPKQDYDAMHETFVKWEDGFDHLQPLADQIEAISLVRTLILPADLARLKTEFPKAQFITATLAEVSENAYRKNQLLKWATPEAAECLRSFAASAKPAPKPRSHCLLFISISPTTSTP